MELRVLYVRDRIWTESWTHLKWVKYAYIGISATNWKNSYEILLLRFNFLIKKVQDTLELN